MQEERNIVFKTQGKREPWNLFIIETQIKYLISVMNKIEENIAVLETGIYSMLSGGKCYKNREARYRVFKQVVRKVLSISPFVDVNH